MNLHCFWLQVRTLLEVDPKTPSEILAKQLRQERERSEGLEEKLRKMEEDKKKK